MDAKMKRWALIGHWHGSPCLCRIDESPPPFAVWFRISERKYREYKREGFFVRRSLERPEEFLSEQDKVEQRSMPEYYEW